MRLLLTLLLLLYKATHVAPQYISCRRPHFSASLRRFLSAANHFFPA